MDDGSFLSLWLAQQEQQEEFGLSPELMDDNERRRTFSDFVQHLHEEVSALGLAYPVYKRHVLETRNLRGDGTNHVALEKCVDIVKMSFAVAQLLGFDRSDFVHAFEAKTRAMSMRYRQSQSYLREDTKLFCFDLDGVVADLGRHLAFRGLYPKDPGDKDPAAALARSELLKQEFHESDGFRHLEPIAGAVEALNLIREKYGMIHVAITARPQWQFKNLYSDTLYWLRKHGVPCDRIIFNRNKVEALFELRPAWPVAFVEDHMRNAADLVDVGVDVLLFDQPYNRLPSAKGERVVGWEGVLAALERRIQAKKETDEQRG